jgi:outer membrane receptor protein involved in Fe transport
MKRFINLVISICFSICILSGTAFSKDSGTGGEVFDLGEVLISGKGTAVDLATTVTEITAADIKIQGATTVAEALDLAPGVDVQVGGKGQAMARIRGFAQEDVRVLIDGVPTHESYYGDLDLGMIPTDAIAKIEITKGASSVLYGPNTMGGVINIITKKGGKEPLTQFTTSFGTNDEKNYILSHGAAAGKFNYFFTYGYRSSGKYELADDFDPNNPRNGIGTEYNEDGDLRDSSDFIKRSLNAKIGFEPSDLTKVYLTFDYHNNERGLPTSSDRYWEFTQWDQWQLSLAAEHSFSDFITVKARAYYVEHKDCLTDISWDNDHQTTNNGRKWFEKSSYDDYTVGGEIHSYFDFGKYSLLKVGVSYMRDNHQQQDFLDDESFSVVRGWDPIGLSPEEEYEADTYSIGIEDEIRPMEKLALVIGASIDFYDPREASDLETPDEIDSINPQVGVVYDLTDAFQVHGSVGKKIRFPQLFELYSDYGGGNYDLDPQESISYEIGASMKFATYFSGAVAFFYNDIDDKIDRIRNADGDRVFVNIGESEVIGMEVRLDISPYKGFFGSINYTLLSTDEKADPDAPEQDAEGTPEHKVNVMAGYNSSFGLGAYVQVAYTSDQKEYMDDGPFEIDDFILVNARMSYCPPDMKKLGMEFFGEAKNLFDENYEEGSGPRPGRSFLAGVTFTY